MNAAGVSQLTLVPAVLRRTFQDGNVTRHPESHYLDFVIDGISLADRWHGVDGLVTPLNRAWLPTMPQAVEELLGQRQAQGLDPGRVPLLVCGVCGALECGTFTASVHLDSDVVTWTGFAWEGSQAADISVEGLPAAYAFHHSDYTETLHGALDRISAFAYDELAHQGRKFLWPWQWGWRLPR